MHVRLGGDPEADPGQTAATVYLSLEQLGKGGGVFLEVFSEGMVVLT